MAKIVQRVELLLGLDTRSLGLFRVSLGLIILYDLLVRALSIEAHYTDNGIISRHVLGGISENPLLLSLNMLSGGVAWQVLLFIAASFAAMCLVVGFKTRLATITLAILMLSIHVRNPFINNLGDWFLLHLLFWSCLLPLGARFSMDSRKERHKHVPSQVLSIATLGIILQLASLYFFSVDHKISPIWQIDHTAIHYALSLDRLVTPVGERVLDLPSAILEFLTVATLFLERWGTVLIFFPFLLVPTRIAIIASFILFHLGLALTFNLGIFPFICMSAWLMLVPGKAWESSAGFLSKLNFRSHFIVDKEIDQSEGVADEVSIGFVYSTIISCSLLLLTISSNLFYSGHMSVPYYEGLYKYVEPMVNSFNLRQRWNMFSPHPSKRDGWFLLVGVKDDGTLIRIDKSGERVSWKRPGDVSVTYKNQRWRKNMEWVMMRWDPHARLVGDYFLQSWNDNHALEEQVSHVLVYFMVEYATGPYDTSQVEKRLLYSTGQ